MKRLDNVISNILLRVGLKRKVEPEKVERIMNSYFKAIKMIVDSKEEAVSIKMDFFGKIIYDKVAAESIKKARRTSQEYNLMLNEINNYRSRNQTT